MRLVFQTFTLICLLFTATIATSQSHDGTYPELFRDFNPAGLTHADKRFLQTALAFEGHYNGLLDGSWGRLSQRAMSRYSWSQFGTETENWHMAMLAWSFFQIAERDGWRIRYIPALDISALWPEEAFFTDAPSENFLNFRHSRSSLSISYGRLAQSAAVGVHDYTLKTHARTEEPYTVRKTGLAISAATDRYGATLYTRSDYLAGAWSTIMLHASAEDNALLNAVAASLAKGRAAPLQFSETGKLAYVINAAVAVAESSEEDPADRDRNVASPPPAGSNESPGASSGSGFIVSSNGHVLTNEHVVSGCTRITVDGEHSVLVATSEEFDLALLQSTAASNKQAAVFSAKPAQLNSDVTAIGFPYAGLLGGLNVTRGSVSSLKGLGGNATTMQITAPVQSGNSGGPLLAADGEVVGVVVSKLDAGRVSDIMGDVPQNVNFAIRGEIATLFLAQNGIDPNLSLSDEKLLPEQLAQRAQSFTVFIECN